MNLAPPYVTLERATARDAAMLSNLMELYIHDLSAMFDHVRLGDDGRFGYAQLGSYLDESNSRFAFVIRQQGRIAGFVLARRGSPASADPDVLDIAEFFVLRQFRGRGVGRTAALALWEQLPGAWSIRAAARNQDAVRFWRKVVAEYTGGRATEAERRDGSTPWIVLLFDNSRSATEQALRDD